LDWNGHTLWLLPGEVNTIGIGVAGALTDDIFLVKNASAGSYNITVAGLQNSTTPYVVGDFLLLRDKKFGRQFTTILIAIDLSTNTIKMADSLVEDWTTDMFASIVHNPTVVRGASLLNLVIDANGNNGNASICLEMRFGCINCYLENLMVTGAFGIMNRNGVQGMWIHRLYKSEAANIYAMNFSTSSIDGRDIQFFGCTQTTIDTMVSIDPAGFGPGFAHCDSITVENLRVTQANARGLAIDTTRNSVFTNIIVANGNTPAPIYPKGSGLCFRFGSHNNTVTNLVSWNNDDFGLKFDGGNCIAGQECDSYNTIINAQLIKNRNGPTQASYAIVNGVNSRGNVVIGTWDGLVMDLSTTRDLQMTRFYKGFTEQSLSRVCPTYDDFSGKWNVLTCIRCMPANNQLKECCMWYDGVMRCITHTLA
jgi:hypothetical protein